MVAVDPSPARSRRHILIGAGLLFAVQLAAIGTIFKHAISFNCLSNWPASACQSASGTLVSLYCIFGALMLFAMLKPQSLHALTRQAGEQRWPLGLNLVGALITLIPVTFMQDGAGTSVLLPAFGFWILGMGLLLAGLALYVAPLPLWRPFLSQHSMTVLPMIGLGAAAPFLATLIRPIWQLETIAAVTFKAVAWIIEALGYQVETYAVEKVIGFGDFYIDVAPQCSGVEGLALVTVFVSIYLRVFRQDLIFPRAFWLFPIGLAASALFNVVRIAVLLIIGLEGNAELAVGGFHSHAGWLMFTLVALGIIALAQNVPALQKSPATPLNAAQRAPLPLLQDPMVARILPFAVFMFSALLASAFSQSPGVIYPARVLLMVGVIALFWPLYARLPWRLDPVALGVGLAIGFMWIVIPVAPSDSPPPYGTLTGALMVGWFLLRGLGTVVLVPIIEELFFRDYLEKRLQLGTGIGWKIVAAIITAVLFALLHDRIAEAFVASLLFSSVMHRTGRIMDAILAHSVANAVIFGVALTTGQIHII